MHFHKCEHNDVRITARNCKSIKITSQIIVNASFRLVFLILRVNGSDIFCRPAGPRLCVQPHNLVRYRYIYIVGKKLLFG